MGRFDRRDCQLLDPEFTFEMADIQRSQLPPAGRINLLPDIDGNRKPPRDRPDPLVMIPMRVGEDDAVDILNLFPQEGHPPGRFRETFPGVEQHRGAAGLQMIAISITPGCNDRYFHW